MNLICKSVSNPIIYTLTRHRDIPKQDPAYLKTKNVLKSFP